MATISQTVGFDFDIEYKSFDRTLQFHYQWLELFGLLEETNIEPSVACLKPLSIFAFIFLTELWVSKALIYSKILNHLDLTDKPTQLDTIRLEKNINEQYPIRKRFFLSFLLNLRQI